MSEWVLVDSIPARGATPPPRPRLSLEPGQIIRWRAQNHSSGGGYNLSFQRSGRTDYHAVTRDIDGQRYLYIWRDPLPEGVTP